MATITASVIIAKVRIILQDPDAVRWDAAELLGWVNDGQREIVLLKPDASTISATKTLTDVNETRHSIPADGISLVEITRNTVGTKRSIRLIDREILDAQNPEWHDDGSTSEVKYYMFDPRNPREFLVFPPNDGNGSIEIIYSKAPTDVEYEAVIQIDDIYANALADYVLYKAYSKDAEYAANGQRAAAAYSSFAQSLGLKIQAESQTEQRRGAA